MNKIVQNLRSIEKWVDFNSPPPTDFKTNTEFMKFSVEIMNRCLYLLKTGTASAPDIETAKKGYSKHKAIIVGHMVRITKLYEGVLIHICNQQLELAHILSRLIIETTIMMEYLIASKSKRESCRSFILASYKPEKEMLKDLKSKAKNRSLIPIEKRMIKSIISRLKRDGISQKELYRNKNWNVDGKNFRDIMKQVNSDSIYTYGFGSTSHHVHGDWRDIEYYHLKQDGRYYTPELFFDEPDPRFTCPITEICLDSLLKYMKWNKSDPERMICNVTVKLHELNLALDQIHENSIQK